MTNHKPFRIVLFRGKGGPLTTGPQPWRFRVVAANGEKIGQSEAYHNLADAQNTARILRDPGRNRVKADLFRSETNDQWYWRLKGGNGKIILQSEGYHRIADAGSTLALVLSMKPGNSSMAQEGA